MPAPAQNIFHGMNKTDHIDLKYTIPEERIYGRYSIRNPKSDGVSFFLLGG
jgi:hypothetical protein